LPKHRFLPSGPLKGHLRVPGDKSISHRSIMFGSLAVGRTRISGLLEGEDVLATAEAMRLLGAKIEKSKDEWLVEGVGVGSLLQPPAPLSMGNSGTSVRLLMGLIASHGITAKFQGDASLSKRPMGRVIEPLTQMGASFEETLRDNLPITINGADPAIPIQYRLPVASAQVKSAVLLAGLNTPGTTTVIEPVLTRDHSERMLRGFGTKIEIDQIGGERAIHIEGQTDLMPQEITVPGDPSSAAFFVVAGQIIEGSDFVIENVGLNPSRTGLFDTIREMGGYIKEIKKREVGGEPVADLHVRHSVLTGIDVDPAIVPSMIDEFPILFVAAAMAEGRTSTTGLSELRIKESDRLAAMAEGLRLAGVEIEERADGLIISGSGGALLSGNLKTHVKTHLDHRIAMSMAIAGLVSNKGIEIDDTAPISTSYPTFVESLNQLTGGNSE
jgi:3-phosphoshikimate 1-carboxyvinyltransferase